MPPSKVARQIPRALGEEAFEQGRMISGFHVGWEQITGCQRSLSSPTCLFRSKRFTEIRFIFCGKNYAVRQLFTTSMLAANLAMTKSRAFAAFALDPAGFWAISSTVAATR